MSSILKVNTLQDGGGNAIITSDGSGTFTSNLPNTGITMVDQWRLTANLSISGNGTTGITANLERVDTNTPGFIGTGMTESSGVFTFPSTGIYKITSHWSVLASADSTFLRINKIYKRITK